MDGPDPGLRGNTGIAVSGPNGRFEASSDKVGAVGSRPAPLALSNREELTGSEKPAPTVTGSDRQARPASPDSIEALTPIFARAASQAAPGSTSNISVSSASTDSHPLAWISPSSCSGPQPA